MSAAGRLALAVILAWLMPWRAARKIRSQQEAIGYLLDKMTDQHRNMQLLVRALSEALK